MTKSNTIKPEVSRLAEIQQATRIHRQTHGCGAYTFDDGPGLVGLVQSIEAKRVLELGTALGFTACCLAQGHAAARVDTIEADATHVSLARENIAARGLSERIIVHHGRFEDVLPKMVRGYDAGFFDGYEPSIVVLEQMRNLLRKGGLLICANTSLVGNDMRREIDGYLQNPKLWAMKAPIENGRTIVRVKYEVP